MNEYAAEGVEVIPIHPMFGSRIRSLDGQVVVLTPKVTGEWYEKVLNFLENENTRIIVTSPEIHDSMNGVLFRALHTSHM